MITNQAFLMSIFLVMLAQCHEPKHSLCQKVVQASQNSNEEEEVERLLQQLDQSTERQDCLVELSPIYYWAQSMTHLYVKFEFINSPETSACEKVLSVDRGVQHSRIWLKMYCITTSMLIRYSFSIRTFMPMNFYRAQWKDTARTMTLDCMKSPNPYFWKQLWMDKHEPQHKPKLWWEIQQKHKQSLGDFIYDLELAEKEEDVSAAVRNKKSKLPKGYEHLDPHSHTNFYCNHNNPLHLGSWLPQ